MVKKFSNFGFSTFFYFRYHGTDMGVSVSKDISSESTQQIRFPKEQKRPKFGHQGQVLRVYRECLNVKCSRSLWSHFGTIAIFPIFNNLVSRKALALQRIRPKFDMGFEGNYLVYTGYFRRWVFKVSLGSFGAIPIFPIFGNLLSQKWPAVERKWPQFGPRRQVLTVCRVPWLLSVK